MKWSSFNVLIDSPIQKEQVYLYNYQKNKLLTLDMRLKPIIIERRHNIETLKEIHPSLYELLIKCGFIVSSALDEMKSCVDEINSKLQSNDYVRITINPTLDCNLRCWYCYESHLKGSLMSHDTLLNVIMYLERVISSPTLRTFQLAFFGGEPLLYYKKVVHPLIKKCSELCNKYNKKFQVNFTTNGVCLTHYVVDDLINLSNWISVQVAFDGGKAFHDKIKYYKDGTGTYDRVLHNLFYAIEKRLFTTIRCNYTKENILSFYDVVKDFEAYHNCRNLRFSFHKIWQDEEDDNLRVKVSQLKSQLTRFKFQSNINTYLGPSVQHCYADYVHNLVINYNGDIYKCTARDFNVDNKIGSLSHDGNICYGTNKERWEKMYVAECCLACRLLPICTECIQRKIEVGENKCSNVAFRENAEANIRKFFYDIMNFKIVNT